MRKLPFLSLAFGILCAAYPLFAEEVALLPMLAGTDARLEWDAYRGQGAISDGTNTLAFRIGQPTLLLNNREQKPLGPITSVSGRLMASQNAAGYLRTLFARSAATNTVQKRRISTIFLDPGHGGKDPGAIGWHTIQGKKTAIEEKNVVLSVAKLVDGMLKEHFPGKRIAMSRKNDSYLPLEQRTELANNIPVSDNESIVFVSIHANASLKPAAHGFEVWYLPPDYRRSLLDPTEVKPASREVLPILNSMLEEEYTIESILLGKNILDGLEQEVGAVSPRLGLKENSWAVVRNAEMPSVLVEIGFLTNAAEGPRLNDPVYLRKIAAGIYNGIVRYVSSYEQRNSVE